jgi:hypothetical protein
VKVGTEGNTTWSKAMFGVDKWWEMMREFLHVSLETKKGRHFPDLLPSGSFASPFSVVISSCLTSSELQL